MPTSSPHQFVGRLDRGCEFLDCGLPDRADIHKVPEGFTGNVGFPPDPNSPLTTEFGSGQCVDPNMPRPSWGIQDLPVYLEIHSDGRVFAGDQEVEPASVGLVMFECPNCHVRIGVTPVIQGLSHRSGVRVTRADGETLAGLDDFIDVTFEPMPVAHNCPRRRLTIPS